MKRMLALAGFCLACHFTNAQMTLSHIDRARNTVALGVIGNGATLSVQYDRIISIGKKHMISAMAGIGGSGGISILGAEPKTTFVTPHHLTYNFGNKSFFVEAGIGGTFIFSGGSTHYKAFDIIGIRYQLLRDKGVTFRAFAHPIAWFLSREGNSYPVDGGKNVDGFTFLPVGFSVGYSF